MFTDKQVTGVIKLTEAHSYTGLISTFLGMLIELELAQNANYFEIYSVTKDREFGGKNASEALMRNPLDLSFTATPLGTESDCAQAVEKLEIVKKPGTKKHKGRYIIPVVGNLRAVGLLMIDDDEQSRDNWEVICAMVDIFGNLLSLIKKKERDGLTGLLNRLVFEERLHQALHYATTFDRRAGDNQLRFCLALVDVDRFKSVNDELGHLYGDEVLVHLSQIMNRSFRYYDLICRYGGEEFAILLRDVDLAQAMDVLERFRVTVENYHFPQVGNKTVSIGVVQVEPGEIMPSIIDKADKALYYSKTHGRNQMHAYEQLVASGELAPRESKSGDVELF